LQHTAPAIGYSLYLMAFQQGDAVGMEREAARAMGKPGTEDVLLILQASTAAYAGKMVKFREFTNRAFESSRRADNIEGGATYLSFAAIIEALVGNATRAKQFAQSALAASNGQDVRGFAAIGLALAGDAAHATRLGDDLSHELPNSTFVKVSYLPLIHAGINLDGGRSGTGAAAALQNLEVTAPYEAGSPSVSITLNLFPAYVRGTAYLAAGQGSAAAMEFQKLIDRPTVVTNSPYGGLAHLGIGRAYALTGDKAKARVAYQDFLALWKDADPDVPIFQQAKSEYAKLQ
jgi:eukaryotic-like serine/threonine-protein kinase